MQAALRQRGIIVNHKKVRRLMREHDLQPRIRRRFIATTNSDHELPIFPNLAKNVTPDGPNQLWVSDITYVTIAAGFVYVAVIFKLKASAEEATNLLSNGFHNSPRLVCAPRAGQDQAAVLSMCRACWSSQCALSPFKASPREKYDTRNRVSTAAGPSALLSGPGLGAQDV
ncbi:IS3 family transposase [Mesorhizobium sp. WSM1293]|uniref:IS3 family transposase n=1 Tax=Mesorhizobium sp. WSM1293 TaxID=1040984 RepID=UPI0004884273|nr:IS3 family transposase [Mesorhizobium sp. WSM1293]